MKKLLSLFAFFVVGFASAQVDPQQPKPVKPPVPTQKDTVTTNKQIQTESDLKTLDAIKTNNHPKIIKKSKASKDTISRNTRRNKLP